MNIKEIKESIVKEKVLFGLKQTLKYAKKNPKKEIKVVVASNARPKILEKLEKLKIKFEKLKLKSEISKELGLNFEFEVASIKE
ncbi:MAG: hypothetical protein ACOYT4_04235 [Nanoarchaeota archaeon]